MHLPLRYFHDFRRNLLCALLVFCFASAATTSARELTKIELEKDSTIQEQTDKTGAYRIGVKAIPLDLFMKFSFREGMITDKKAAKKSMTEHDWLIPNKDEGQDGYSFQVVVPEDYNREQPPGILVWVSSGDNGAYPRHLLKAVKSANLILIGANNSGNKRGYPLRMTLATHAVDLIKRRYAVDEQRIYISGFSGGAGTSNTLTYYQPDLFKGTVLLFGSAMLTQSSVYGTLLKEQPSRQQLNVLANKTHFYIITGSKDSAKKICV